MSKAPTRLESVLGLFLFAGILGLVGKCVAGGPDASASAPKCQTELDCKLAANTERLRKSRGAAASARRHLEGQQYDVAQGIRTGKLSASDLRSEGGTLVARQRIVSDAEAECEAARAEAQLLGDEAARVVRAQEKAAAPPAPKPTVPAKSAKAKHSSPTAM